MGQSQTVGGVSTTLYMSYCPMILLVKVYKSNTHTHHTPCVGVKKGDSGTATPKPLGE